MEKKSKKAYNKAMEYYEKGLISKAIEICDEEISKDLSNASILNFKGLLLYQKGELKEAVTTWKLNKDINKDSTAENYIKDSRADEERLKLYKEAEYALKQLKIDRALELFKKCSESGFNSIKVNTGIALCYEKKGDYFRAKEYVDKALNIDKAAITASALKKELDNLGVFENSGKSSKRVLVIATMLFAIAAVGAGAYSIYTKLNNKQNEVSQTVVEDSKVNTEKEEVTKQAEDTAEAEKIETVNEDKNEDKTDDKEIKSFDRTRTEKLVADKDADGVYECLNGIDKTDVKTEDLDSYNAAVKFMKEEGVSELYKLGVSNFNTGNYNAAEKVFERAYKYSEGNMLKEHILFYRGSTESKLENNKEASDIYEQYYKLYPKGSYVEGVLYELALMNTPDNKEKSKLYANKLRDNYPNSMYINEYILNIINN